MPNVFEEKGYIQTKAENKSITVLIHKTLANQGNSNKTKQKRGGAK